MKGIHSHWLDFSILETNSPQTLVFLDTSEYFENPEQPLLEITLPGQNKYFLVNIAARKVNTFNSNTIGLTEVLENCNLIDLPDGVYKFKYKICPYQYVNRIKYHLRTTVFQKSLNILLDSLEDSDCSARQEKKLKATLIETFLLIESAKASAELGHVDKASDKYQQALKTVNTLLDKLQNQC